MREKNKKEKMSMENINKQESDDEVEEEADAGDEIQRMEKRRVEFFKLCKAGLQTKRDKKKLIKLLNDELLNVLAVDDNKWSALQWAVVNNHPEIVKMVYPKVKQEQEKKKLEEEKKLQEENANARRLNDLDEDFKKPDDPAKKGEYTPLHWSAYKGFDVISSILLQLGCDPLQVDRTGNNALHQACASNKMSTFKLFMGLGIDLEYKNARSHMPIELVMNKEILDLVKKCLTTKECQICHKGFDFFNKRYICSIKNEIVCLECCKIGYYYETEDAEDKDVRDCRCKNCQEEIEKIEAALRAAIDSGVLENVTEKFNVSKNYKICEHLKKKARLTEDRLRREKQIREHLDSLKVVENHKTINKSVDTLVKMLEDADKNNVELDTEILIRANKENQRLLAERDLRQILDNLTVAMASQENLDNLSQKVEKAKAEGVAAVYVDVGDDLVSKISRNLAAKKLLQDFCEYPIREYPEVEEVDPKKSKRRI